MEQDTVLISLKGSIILSPTFDVYNNTAPQHSKLAAFRDDIGIEESASLEVQPGGVRCLLRFSKLRSIAVSSHEAFA